MYGAEEKESIYKLIGSIIVVVKIILAVITFLINLRSIDLIGAVFALGIDAISTLILVVPFFALHDMLVRVERLEKEFFVYNKSETVNIASRAVKAYTKNTDEPEEDYKGFSFDDYIQEPIREQKETEPKCTKGILDDRSWQCSCGKINPIHTGTCGCGERRPQYKQISKENNKESSNGILRIVEESCWQCSGCGKINQYYIGTCSCGERRSR